MVEKKRKFFIYIWLRNYLWIF